MKERCKKNGGKRTSTGALASFSHCERQLNSSSQSSAVVTSSVPSVYAANDGRNSDSESALRFDAASFAKRRKLYEDTNSNVYSNVNPTNDAFDTYVDANNKRKRCGLVNGYSGTGREQWTMNATQELLNTGDQGCSLQLRCNETSEDNGEEEYSNSSESDVECKPHAFRTLEDDRWQFVNGTYNSEEDCKPSSTDEQSDEDKESLQERLRCNDSNGEQRLNEQIKSEKNEASEEELQRIAEEKWENVNGTRNSDGEWREWHEMSDAYNAYTGELLHILPYVNTSNT